MYRYNTIASEGEIAKIEGLVDKNGRVKKDWVWIEFLDLKDKDHPKQSLVWDNSSFIFENFYNFLLRWKERKLHENDEIVFEDVWSIINEDNVEELLEMIEEAKKLNWDK